MKVIRSRENARIKSWSRLAEEPGERRKQSLAVIEGIHVVETFLQQGGVPVSLILAESAVDKAEVRSVVKLSGVEPVVVADSLFKRIAEAATPMGIAAEIRIPEKRVEPGASAACVFLDGVQDAGNVGAIIRSAAAFGIRDIFIGRGCADPWSPKALRAAMGGHFFLTVTNSGDLVDDIGRFGPDSVCAVAHEGKPLGSFDLTGRVAWIFGSEGAGVSKPVAEAASHKATIPTPGGAESLNVAASAAICFYERDRQLSRRAGGA